MPFEPADFHLFIPQFRWRAIATTNFDLIVERAYASASTRLQNPVKTKAQFSFNGVEGCGPRPHNSAGRYLGFSGPERGAHIRSVQGFCRRLVRAGER